MRPIFFGGRLIAIEKKSVGFSPIAVEYRSTFRRLISKCVNAYAQLKLKDYFHPIQLRVAVSGDCEAAVHASRRFMENFNSGEAVAQLDFSNAFNTIRRDGMLQSVSQTLPNARFYEEEIS